METTSDGRMIRNYTANSQNIIKLSYVHKTKSY